MSNRTNDKSTVASATAGKHDGVNEGFSGTQFQGGSFRYQHGLDTEPESSSNGPKLSEQLATGGKHSIVIRTDNSGNQTSEVINNGPRQYEEKAGQIAEGVTAVDPLGHAIHSLADLTDESLVTMGGLEMKARDAMKAGLLEKNPDGSYKATEGTTSDTTTDTTITPIVSQEAMQGVENMSSLAGESVDSLVLDVFLATAAGESELADQLVDGLVQKVGSKMTKGQVVKASQQVINSLVKEVRAIRPDGLDVAMGKLDKMMGQNDYHKARSTVMAIYNGDRKALNSLLK